MMNRDTHRTNQLHTRTITCEAFSRDDDLIDIEGTLIDVKHQPFTLPERGVLMPGDALHEMKFVITIDSDFYIRDAWTATLQSPYRICNAINDHYRQIIGLRIEPGFTSKVKQLFKGIDGCAHLTEMLPTMATIAYQVGWTPKNKQISNNNSSANSVNRPTPFGGCHALRYDGEVVKVYYPQHFKQSLSSETRELVSVETDAL
jgi:hypothetical protein